MSRRKQTGPGSNASAPFSATSVARRFSQAQQLHQQGRLNEAEPLYRELLNLNPNAPGPMHFLGLLQMQRGDLEQAEALMAGALKQLRDPVFLANYGLLQARVGRHEQAVALYQEAVDRHPAYAEAWFNLGVSSAELGSYAQAIAAYQKATTIRPDYAKALFNLAALLHVTNDIAGAEEVLQRLEQMGATSGHGGADLALALQRVGGARNSQCAFRILKQALERNPEDLEAGLALARMLDEAARHDEALPVYRSLAEHQPGRINVALAYAECLVRNGMLEAARQQVQALPSAVRDEPAARVILGDISRFEGDFAAAMAQYESALIRDPSCVGALHGIAQSRRFEPSDVQFLGSLTEIARRKGSALLRFDEGKICDDMGRYDAAFAAFAEANRLRSRSLAYDPAAFTSQVDAIMRTFDAVDVGRLAGAGDSSRRPVFILGAPRSGTSLVEQMLASHPAVARGGELATLGQLARNRATGQKNEHTGYPERITWLTPAQVSAEAAGYLAQTDALVGQSGASHVTDKMPVNFLYIGYLWLLFPRATVIHCRRHPADTCLSMFFQSFSASYPFAFDLDTLAAWYRDYRRLMQYWEAKFPGQLLHVDYRDAVMAPGDTLVRMLQWIGLDWDPACKEFHRATGPVLNASHWQVRQPVYTRSLDRWRHYQQHIPQLLALVEAAPGGAVP